MVVDVAFALIKGIGFGLAVAAPVGPIGLLCIRYGLSSGFGAGVRAGMGAAVADGIYGMVTVFGLAGLGAVVAEAGRWMGLVGGVFLLWIGASLLWRSSGRRRVEIGTEPEERARGRRIFLVTIALTLSNPMTILTFIGLFATLESAGAGASLSVKLAVVAGVFLGSALWWVVLAGMASRIGSRISGEVLRWIDRVSGLLIVGFGLLAIGRTIGI